MKILLALVTVISLSVGPLSAADGKVPARHLSRMGLAGMKPLSDADGMAIRGQAVAVVFSFAFVAGKSPAMDFKISNGSLITATSARANSFSFAASTASASAH